MTHSLVYSLKQMGERADNEKGGKRMLVYRLLLVVDRGIEPLCQD